jgi:hypothetical protein
VILHRMREHPDAPRWNHSASDRIEDADLIALEHFREELGRARSARGPEPPPIVLQRIASLRERVPSFRRRLEGLHDLERDWAGIATMSREDIAVSVPELIPDDADLERLIVYRTAGTTGHALLVPHHARAAASYQPLIEHALARYGVEVAFDAEMVGAFNVGAQARTVTYATTLRAWNGSGFAKLNLRPGDWPHDGSSRRYFRDLAPAILTGDPISFSEMLRLGIDAKPRAMITTAVAMSSALRRKLSDAYACPVIDWYSLTETGPIGYLCPQGESYHLLPHDVHIETVRPDGAPAAEGERGEIAVSGGRNPFLPLLRYRTGDYGHLDFTPCACRDPMPRIRELEGRAPVLFRAADGSLVNPVDLSRILREFPFVQHELRQDADRSCTLIARPAPGSQPDLDAVAHALHAILGGLRIDIRLDPHLGDRADGKVVPYQSALLLED